MKTYLRYEVVRPMTVVGAWEAVFKSEEHVHVEPVVGWALVREEEREAMTGRRVPRSTGVSVQPLVVLTDDGDLCDVAPACSMSDYAGCRKVNE